MARTTIRSEDIADSEITSAKIADSTVVAADVADDSITNAKIKSDAAIAATKLAGTLDLSSKTVTLPAASVTAHVTQTDLSPVRNDIATLALHSAIADNKAAYNLSNAFIDQFEDSSGIDVLTTSQRHSGEYMMVESGVETQLAHDEGSIDSSNYTTNESVIYDGVTGNESNAGASASGTSEGWIIYDFGAGNAKTLTKTITYGRPTASGYGGYAYANPSLTATVYGSNDNSSFTSIGAVSFTDGSSVTAQTITHSSTTAYRYIKTTMSGGGSIDRYFTEIEHFHIPDEPSGNYTSATQTAQSSVSSMGIVVLYKNQTGTATLNSDISVQLSANGGTNYTSATLVAGGTFSSGINIAAISGVSVTAGTTPKYKISFANQASASKETQVHGVALLY